MEKKDLIQFCRYYKGEKENPYNEQDKALLWDYERIWISYNFSDNGRDVLAKYLEDYVGIGLSLFEIHDDIPVSLKALLFNRYAKYSYSLIDAVEPFKKFYKQMYC